VEIEPEVYRELEQLKEFLKFDGTVDELFHRLLYFELGTF
jgi:hypothetical protein